MKYVKEQLQGMSDFEVNKALAKLLGWRVAEIGDSSMLLFTTSFHERYPNTIWAGKPEQSWEQFCFTAADCAGGLMPIAFQYIALIQELKDGWHVESKSKDVWCWSFIDKNPMRAIACCLILVLQDKQ